MSDELNQDTQEKVVRTERRVASGDFARIWANDAQIAHTPWDFRLALGHIMQATEDLLEVENQVEIHVSPQFARRLLQVLGKNIEKYEANFGEIHLPPGMENVDEGEEG